MIPTFQKKFERIKNIQVKELPRDFSFNGFSWMILALFLLLALVLQQMSGTSVLHGDMTEIVSICGAYIFAGGILIVLPLWAVFMVLVMGLGLAGVYLTGTEYLPMMAVGTLGLLFASSFQLVYQWDKVVVLRMGRFRKVHGPGLFFLFPLLDRVASFIDTRIRATDFSAEKSLTLDTVPVHVDALCFWMIWDPQKAVLEVENYMEAVTLSAQTALRDSIGRHDLHTLLSERDVLSKEIQQTLDEKTNPWGISILSIEFTDIVIPQELEDAMSKQAQAERERKSRVILGQAEVEVAEKFRQAAKVYENDATALQLRSMNMVYDGIRQKKGSLMVLPSSALDQMNLGTTMALQAKNEVDHLVEEKNKEKNPQGGKEL